MGAKDKELRRTDARVSSIAHAYVKPEHVNEAHAHFARALNEHMTPEQMNALTDDDLHNAFKEYARAVPEHAKPKPVPSSREMRAKAGFKGGW